MQSKPKRITVNMMHGEKKINFMDSMVVID